MSETVILTFKDRWGKMCRVKATPCGPLFLHVSLDDPKETTISTKLGFRVATFDKMSEAAAAANAIVTEFPDVRWDSSDPHEAFVSDERALQCFHFVRQLKLQAAS